MREITIPTSVTSIGQRGLEACFKLKALVLPRGFKAIQNYTFRCNYAMEVLSIPDTVTTLLCSFPTCVALGRVTIPEGVTAIAAMAFQRCFAATVINVPDTVKSFGANCFHSCYALRALRIPEGVTAIPPSLAQQCHSLREVEIPEGVVTIGKMAFSGCFAIKELVIPSTVTSIGAFAFLYTDGTSVFRVKAETPPTLEPTAFSGLLDSITIYVPYSSDHSILEAYLAATGWSALGDSIVEEEPE